MQTVTQEIVELAEGIQRNALLAEDLATGSQELSAQSDALLVLANRFKV